MPFQAGCVLNVLTSSPGEAAMQEVPAAAINDAREAKSGSMVGIGNWWEHSTAGSSKDHIATSPSLCHNITYKIGEAPEVYLALLKQCAGCKGL